MLWVRNMATITPESTARRIKAIRESTKAKTAKMNADAEKILKRQGKPLKYDSSKLFAYKFADYMCKCDNTIIDPDKGKTEPYTLTGLQLATGLAGGAWQRYIDGTHDKNVVDHTKEADNGTLIECGLQDTTKSQLYDYDSREELKPYMDFLYDNSDVLGIIYSTVYQKARTAVQQQAELRLYLRGSVADIFTLKSKYGWQEENKTVHRVEIATSEDARQALEELKLIE